MNAIVHTEDLCLGFGAKRALDQMNLSLPEGGIHALVGTNGAGKSTLFRVLLGLATPDRGKADVLGQDCRQLSASTRADLAYVSDDHALPAWQNADSLAAFQRAFYPRWDEDRFQRVIRLFDLEPSQPVRHLSRGERAGLNLALVLAQGPRLMILDEPTLGLDLVARRKFLEALMYSRDSAECTVLFASHDAVDIERVADSITFIEQGRAHAPLTPLELVDGIEVWIARTDQAPDLPSMLEVRELEGMLQLFTRKAGDSVVDALQSQGATDIVRQAVNFEQAVTAVLAKHKADARRARI